MKMFKKNSFKSKLICVILINGVISQILVPVLYAETMTYQRTFILNDKYQDAINHIEKIKESIPLNDQNNLVQFKIIDKKKENTALKVLGGPGQAESSGFSLNSTSGLVDDFTGDFSYSIPLMDVDGFPVVIKYNSNVLMNSESSWVGLGWDLNVGSMTREMRGVPDEFNGNDLIDRVVHSIPEDLSGEKKGKFIAVSYSIGKSSILLTPSVQLTRLKGSYYSSIVGSGTTFDFGLQARFDVSSDYNETSSGALDPTGHQFGLKFAFGYSSDSKMGVGLNKSFGVSYGYIAEKTNGNGGIGLSYGTSKNSRSGMQQYQLSSDLSGGIGGNRSLSMNAILGSSVPFGSATSIPKIQFSAVSEGFQFQKEKFVKFGVAGLGMTLGHIKQNYSNTNEIINNGLMFSQSAIGYLHSGKIAAVNNNLYVMDFERSNESNYSTNMMHLPAPIQTYDIFYFNTPTSSGTFRANRTDVGTYNDALATTQHKLGSLGSLPSIPGIPSIIQNILDDLTLPSVLNFSTGVIVQAPPKFAFGLSGGIQKSETKSNGAWENGVNLAKLKFTSQSASNKFDNTTYFKIVGETTPSNMNAWNYLGGNNNGTFKTLKVNKDIQISNDYNNSAIDISQVNSQNTKPIAATVIEPIIADEITKPIDYYNEVNLYTSMPRITNIRKSNHISKVEVTDPSGSKNIFGIPAYNKNYSEVSFSAGGLNADYNIVSYDANIDNSVNNTRGRMHYYDKTTMPGYAHSFLLTEILSSDYVDRTDDGPSIDDVGSYHKIDYVRVDDDFKWRIPISGTTGQPKSFFNDGLTATKLDDTGNYSYGEKEIWYTKTIEGKNYIAVFVLKDRKDGYQVSDENGFLNTNSTQLKCLDKIELYNLSEYRANPGSAKALQTVQFSYDYSSCKGFPQNIYSYDNATHAKSGKLTLTNIKIYTGALTANNVQSFDFTYGKENQYNPNFSYNNVDAWGAYQANDQNRPNNLFPYVHNKLTDVQNSAERAYAWKLTKITQPLSGSIQIDYENDHYSYVQDQRATRMFNLVGMMSNADLDYYQNTNNWSGTSDIEYIFQNSANEKDKNVKLNNNLIFKLDKSYQGVTLQQASANFKNDYLTDPYNNEVLSKIFIKASIDVNGDNIVELIPMFLDIVNYGVMPAVNGEYQYGYINVGYVDVKNIETPDDKKEKETNFIHPIQRVAIDYARQNLPDIIYGACDGCLTSNGQVVDHKVIFGHDLYKVFANKTSFVNGINPIQSSIRLFEPDNYKVGGNSCVSRITYSDNWDNISGEYLSIYQWDYSYADSDLNDPYKLSYGVAGFEPNSILDENTMYYWDTYVNNIKKFHDESEFHPMPVLRELYPNPVIGYEKVNVQFFSNQNINSNKGYSISQFHTYKEKKYKTRLNATSVVDHSSSDNYKSPLNFFGGTTYGYYGFTEGYLLETNDFHGKPLSVETYDGDNKLQISTKYKYYEFNEPIPVMDRKTQITNEQLGVDYDIYGDERNITSNNSFNLIGANLAVGFGVFKVSPIFVHNKSKSAFYSYCVVKHINRSAIVKSVETVYLNSVNNAENLLYDKYSGGVIASSLTDEFDDKLYSFNYPAHWNYNELKELSNLKDKVISGNLSSTGFTVLSALDDFNTICSRGDQIQLKPLTGQNILATVLSVSQGVLNLIDNNTGVSVTGPSGNYDLSIIRSNRDNNLFATMQSITTKKAINLTNPFQFPDTEILSCNAITLRDKHNLKCGVPPIEGAGNEVQVNSIINPFKYGVLGDLILDGQYAWQSSRINNTHPMGVRFDGAYSTFSSFYTYNTSVKKWYLTNSSPYWRKLGEARITNEYGNVVESVDQLNIPSAVINGYAPGMDLLPVAQATNAHKNEIGFDGFEDYNYLSNFSISISSQNKHFSFKDNIGSQVSLDAINKHSGLFSLKVNPSSNATITRLIKQSCDMIPNGYAKGNTFTVNDCLCIPPFSPSPNKEYVVGGWIKQTGSSGQIHVKLIDPINTSNNVDKYFYASTKVIDGWQRIEGVFNIPSNITSISVSLENTGAATVNFDDIRIHPFLAGMSTVVYDPKTLLPLATHDGYNFTTFYNYDKNLKLVRVRVETEEGIKTITETESGGQIKY